MQRKFGKEHQFDIWTEKTTEITTTIQNIKRNQGNVLEAQSLFQNLSSLELWH